jgi:hypothetical protein
MRAIARAISQPISRITSAPTSFGNHAKNSSLARCRLSEILATIIVKTSVSAA